VKWTGVLRVFGVGAGAIAIFAFTSIYRFNTLGGAFAGFDNDHFLHFAYAKQVQAGERPLKDFDDLALQGAWPYLTYSVSATAQNLLGNSLRSEALVTIGAVALAAALTFVAASLVAPTVVAALAAAVTIFVAPTLYNYPKVLVLSGGALLIVLYARAPTRARVACLSVLSALAFAFRHDYTVYLAVGAFAVIAACAPTPRAGIRHALLYAALTTALLLPSLTYIQRYVGLANHARDALSLSRSEAARTPLSWPTFTASSANGEPLTPFAFLGVEQNAIAWLYYLIVSLPVIVMALLWHTRSDGRSRADRAAPLALAVTLLVANPLLLRGNVAVRFGDIGPLYAVVLASALEMSSRRRVSEPRRQWVSRLAASALVVAATVMAVWTAGYIRQQLETARLSVSWRAALMRADQLWQELEALPAAYWSEPHPSAFVNAVQYVNRCTGPDDRVLIMPYWPELLPLADRRFAGGRSSVLPGFLTTESHQRAIVQRWRQQSVPIVLVDNGEIYDRAYRPAVPLVDEYLREHYDFAGTLRLADRSSLRIFSQRGRVPMGVFGDARLPCFR
jgi:hypothetical protein